MKTKHFLLLCGCCIQAAFADQLSDQNNALISAANNYVDSTISYVAPTPVWASYVDGNNNTQWYVSSYTNTYAEQRARYVQQLTDQGTAEASRANAQAQVDNAAMRQEAAANQAELDAQKQELLPAEEKVRNASAQKGEDADKSTSPLGRVDTNNDGIIEPSEVEAEKAKRVSMMANAPSNATHLDTNGNNTIEDLESSQGTRKRAAKNMDTDGDGIVSPDETAAALLKNQTRKTKKN